MTYLITVMLVAMIYTLGVRSSQSTLKDWPLDQLDPSNAESSSDCKVVNHVFTEKERK